MSEKDIITLRMQHPGSCTGMFWRGNPNTGARAPTDDNWPRNGALLKGTRHEVNGEPWFEVFEIKNAGRVEFEPVPKGTWMLFDQGGTLLHKP